MDKIKESIYEIRKYFYTHETKNIDFRILQLKKIKDWVVKNQTHILEALKKDLNKPDFEAYFTEIDAVLFEINYAIKNLKKWSKNKKIKTPFTQFLSSSYIKPSPYGVVLIISPWNYPFQLSLIPIISAIAAGNCICLKPSEYSINTSLILEKMIIELFSSNYISIFLGDKEISEELLNNKFDYIFFTGSTSIGKLVMKEAAKNLTPVTLELGGKSPCIVDETANIDLSSQRIVWGKLLNAGQTCVAPDYFLVHKSVKKNFIESLKKYIIKFVGDNPISNIEFPKIINETHFYRIMNLIDENKVIFGGRSDMKNLKIEPTILDNVNFSDKIMKQEIFAPIFPIIEYENINDILDILNNLPRPLAQYIFSNSKDNQNLIIKKTQFGGGCINDVISQLGNHYLPFGGVGESGMGNYYGKYGFDTFSHKKSILKKSNLFDISFRYQPYGNKLKYFLRIFKI